MSRNIGNNISRLEAISPRNFKIDRLKGTYLGLCLHEYPLLSLFVFKWRARIFFVEARSNGHSDLELKLVRRRKMSAMSKRPFLKPS